MDVIIKTLEEWSDNKYGYYQKMLYPDGQCFKDTYFSFYRDLIAAPCGAQGDNVSYSVCLVNKRPLVIDVLEYHSNTHEAVLPLDGDILMQVIPASPNGVLPLEQMEVFLIPKGTLVVLKSGVWHHAPYAYGKDVVNVLVGLPERTYANDCTVVELEESIRILD